ncbi:MAG: hypothetical protein ACQEW0_16520 [Pseudomonadota bacterium]
MKLTLNLSPVRSDEETTASLSGTVLTLNGTDYDLSELPDGAEAQHPQLGKVSRDGDEYTCKIRLGHGPNAPHETRFPEPIVLVDHSGPIELPLFNELTDPEILGEEGAEAELVLYTGLAQHSVFRDLLNTKTGIEWIEGTALFSRRWRVDGPYETLLEIKTTWEGMY